MSTRNKIRIFGVAICAIFITGCLSAGDEEDECESPLNVAIVGLESAQNYTTEPIQPSESSRLVLAEEGSSISFKKYVIRVQTSNTISNEPLTSKGVWSFFREAYAACPPGPILRSTQDLETIEVLSDVDYTSVYPAGTSLIELMQIRASISKGRGVGLSDEIFVMGSTLRLQDTFTPLSEYLNIPQTVPLAFDIRFASGPAVEMPRIFKISVILSNGDTYVLSTEQVSLSPEAP